METAPNRESGIWEMLQRPLILQLAALRARELQTNVIPRKVKHHELPWHVYGPDLLSRWGSLNKYIMTIFLPLCQINYSIVMALCLAFFIFWVKYFASKRLIGQDRYVFNKDHSFAFFILHECMQLPLCVYIEIYKDSQKNKNHMLIKTFKIWQIYAWSFYCYQWCTQPNHCCCHVLR